jgi:hypothetical protein
MHTIKSCKLGVEIVPFEDHVLNFVNGEEKSESKPSNLRDRYDLRCFWEKPANERLGASRWKRKRLDSICL